MTGPAPSLDEAILAILADQDLHDSAGLAMVTSTSDRTIRRRLRRLIRDGYVFSPFRGAYRITAAGQAVLAPLAKPAGWLDTSPADLLERWRRGQR
jgi:DeoR/GlpR family transcriptional regulator of sugar metabolism